MKARYDILILTRNVFIYLSVSRRLQNEVNR